MVYISDGGNRMKKIIVSSAPKAELNGVNEPVEPVDTEEVPVGKFEPRFITLHDDQCPYTEEELEQARQEKGGRPLAEIWKSLGA
jgi:hypothetical protein